jgi:hypothetical protein
MDRTKVWDSAESTTLEFCWNQQQRKVSSAQSATPIQGLYRTLLPQYFRMRRPLLLPPSHPTFGGAMGESPVSAVVDGPVRLLPHAAADLNIGGVSSSLDFLQLMHAADDKYEA